MRTYAEILALVSQLLQDSGNATYSEDELDAVIPLCLEEVSRFVPREVKETVVATASREITLSDENKRNLIRILVAEYKVGQYPQQFRNVSRFGDVLTLGLTSVMTAGESVYLYLLKKHILQKEIGTDTLTGAIKTDGAAGATSLELKFLGSGTIHEDTELVVDGEATTYSITADATITTGEATVSIAPALATLAATDAAITLRLSESTLEFSLEKPLVQLCAGEAAISKSKLIYLESKKALTQLTEASSALSNIEDRITQAVADIASGRTEVAKLAAIIDSANTEIDKMDTEIGQAVSDLDSGRALIGGIDTAKAASEYATYANGVINSARGYLETGAGYLREAQGREANNAAYLQQAGHELQTANLYIGQAGASLRLAVQRSGVATAAQHIERWGMNQKQMAEASLRKMARPRVYAEYSEG